MLATTSRIDDDVLRVRWGDPPPADAELVLGRGETLVGVPLIDDSGETRADLSPLDLADGVWRVAVAASGRTAEPVTTTDPGFSIDTLVEYARTARRRRLRAFRADDGELRLEVRTVTPYAEVTAVDPADGRIALEGLFAYMDEIAGERSARLVARRRKSDESVTGEATVSGALWRGSLPIDPLRTDLPEATAWDLHLDGLRLATLLDDVRKKKEKIRFPAQHTGDGEDRTWVRPYYTDYDFLAIRCRRVGKPEAS